MIYFIPNKKKLTALVPVVFVRAIQTVRVTIANVNFWDTTTTVAGEEVAEASPALLAAILLGLVGPVPTIVVTIAVPGAWDATVVGAPWGSKP